MVHLLERPSLCLQHTLQIQRKDGTPCYLQMYCTVCTSGTSSSPVVKRKVTRARVDNFSFVNCAIVHFHTHFHSSMMVSFGVMGVLGLVAQAVAVAPFPRVNFEESPWQAVPLSRDVPFFTQFQQGCTSSLKSLTDITAISPSLISRPRIHDPPFPLPSARARDPPPLSSLCPVIWPY
jgi:hypothetical protein